MFHPSQVSSLWRTNNDLCVSLCTQFATICSWASCFYMAVSFYRHSNIIPNTQMQFSACIHEYITKHSCDFTLFRLFACLVCFSPFIRPKLITHFYNHTTNSNSSFASSINKRFANFIWPLLEFNFINCKSMQKKYCNANDLLYLVHINSRDLTPDAFPCNTYSKCVMREICEEAMENHGPFPKNEFWTKFN